MVVISSRQLKLFLDLPSEKKKLLPGTKGRNPDLLELLVSQGGECLEVDLVTEEDISVLTETLGGQQRRQLVQPWGGGVTYNKGSNNI